MELLDKAAEKAKTLGINVGKPHPDQFGIKFAYHVTYRNTPSFLMASREGVRENELGFCKSIDYWIIDHAIEKKGYVLDYIDEYDSVYEINPEMVVDIMNKRNNNFVGNVNWEEADTLSACPLCGKIAPKWGQCCDITINDRFELFNHRLKYHKIPLPAIGAQNLSLARSVTESNNEKTLDSIFCKEGMPLLYVGNKANKSPTLVKEYGFVPDWIGIGDRKVAVEYDGSKRSSNEIERREGLAKDKGFELYIITVNAKTLQEDRGKLDIVLDDIKYRLGMFKSLNDF